MYQDQPTPLQNFWQNTTTIQKIILFTIPIFFLVIIILSLVFLINPPINYDQELLDSAKHITIDNFDEIAPNMPEFYKLATRGAIWINLRDFNSTPEDTYASAQIRTDSYKVENNTGDGINTSSFIVDIPSLEQSFSISFSWLTNTKIPTEWLINIYCPHYTDVIYPNTICKISNTQLDNLPEYLPTNLDDNVHLSLQKYNQYGAHPNQSYLSVDITTCDFTETYYNSIKEFVNSWLRERFIDPNGFLIEYNPYCNQVQLIEGLPDETEN